MTYNVEWKEMSIETNKISEGYLIVNVIELVNKYTLGSHARRNQSKQCYVNTT